MNTELKNHISNSLVKGIRFDSRKNEDFRAIEIETGIIKTAEGSARVKFGETEVIAGVKMGIDKPYPDTPDQGTMAVGAELLPLSNPEFESGPPDSTAIEVARVIDRGIRESNCIDLKKLCVTKGEKVWSINVDICPINNDGNLIDVGALAALAAIYDARFPEYKDDKVDYKKPTDKKIPIDKKPIAITVLKIGENFIVDPTELEEKALDARLTVTIMDDDSLCAMQKGGDYALTVKEIEKMVDLAVKKSKEIRKLLK